MIAPLLKNRLKKYERDAPAGSLPVSFSHPKHRGNHQSGSNSCDREW
jgi:hypothetical protein